MRILICYFSATGNTENIGRIIGETLSGLGANVEMKDVTLPSSRTAPVDMAEYDAAVFGAPIHSMRAPRVMREYLAGIDGLGKKCAMYFTYGGFQVHPTHYSTQQILKGGGFEVVGSADFPCPHSYNQGGWPMMKDRPYESDIEVARQYADRIFRRFTGEDPGVVGDLDRGPYSEEQLESFESVKYKVVTKLPTRDGAECQMCGLCEEQCPVGAMDMDAGQADGTCMTCFRCVRDCPDEVLKINDLKPIYFMKMEKDGETEETLEKKAGRMYL